MALASSTSEKMERRRSSLRTASPGDLDQYLDITGGDDNIGTVLGDGIVLSVAIQGNNDNALDEDSWGFGDQDQGEESIISEVTWMTYRAEMMKKALIMEYKRLQGANLKKEQKKLERLIRDAYRPTKNVGKQQQQAAQTNNKIIISRTVSTPDLHHMHVMAQKRKSSQVLALASNDEAKLDDIDEEVDSSNTEMVHKRGELAVEFGLRPAHRKRGSAGGIQGQEGDEQAQDKSKEAKDGCVQQQVRDQEQKNGTRESSYLDSIIDLKLQLAQKQSTIDELSQVKAENSMISKENADLKQQVMALQKQLVYNNRPEFNRDDSGATDITGTTTLSSGTSPPRGLSAMSRHLSWIDLRRSVSGGGTTAAPVNTESNSNEANDQ